MIQHVTISCLFFLYMDIPLTMRHIIIRVDQLFNYLTISLCQMISGQTLKPNRKCSNQVFRYRIKLIRIQTEYDTYMNVLDLVVQYMLFSCTIHYGIFNSRVTKPTESVLRKNLSYFVTFSRKVLLYIVKCKFAGLLYLFF